MLAKSIVALKPDRNAIDRSGEGLVVFVFVALGGRSACRLEQSKRRARHKLITEIWTWREELLVECSKPSRRTRRKVRGSRVDLSSCRVAFDGQWWRLHCCGERLQMSRERS